MEWWLIGKAGDNWSNETVQKRGHMLSNKTARAVELAVSGIVMEVEEGMRMWVMGYGVRSFILTF